MAQITSIRKTWTPSPDERWWLVTFACGHEEIWDTDDAAAFLRDADGRCMGCRYCAAEGGGT